MLLRETDAGKCFLLYIKESPNGSEHDPTLTYINGVLLGLGKSTKIVPIKTVFKILFWNLLETNILRLMEEILHQLGCIKPYKYWDIYIYLPYQLVLAGFLNHQHLIT